MNPQDVFHRYQELQAYVGWTDEAARLVAAVAELVDPHLPPLVTDFYAEIERHPAARKVITGGAAQIERLKGTLLGWLRELFRGKYDADYVNRRWRVGGRHVEIGLDQVYTNTALSRLRTGLMRVLQESWPGDSEERRATMRALNTLLDLDLAIIEDAYQAEYAERQQRIERLAAIGQVAGGVAHELRNPLNVIKTSAYYLLNARNPNPEKSLEHLRRIDRHVTLADGVITALSNFARLPVPNLRPLHLEPCLREVVETNPLPDNCQVVIDCPADLPLILGDPDQIRIVFGNIVRNAREAMPQGGRLSLVARPAGVARSLVEVAVSDSGTGIEPELLGRIMEPLYSTKARGLGLGLAITRAILEKNNGTLRVTSEVGHGSTFTVSLQAAPSDTGLLTEEGRS